jgi:hypothetical protein
MKKLMIKLIGLAKKLSTRPEVFGDYSIIYDSVNDHIIIRKARPIEHYFNTLPPLDVDFKDKISLALIDYNW